MDWLLLRSIRLIHIRPASIFRGARTAFRGFAVVASLCPVLFLTWGAMNTGYWIVAIDYVVTAFMLGWMLSALLRPSNVRIFDELGVKSTQDAGQASLSSEAAASPRLSALLRTIIFIGVVILPAIALKWALHYVSRFGSTARS